MTMGYLNENSYFFLMDKATDMVISGEMNVYYPEVEHLVKRENPVNLSAKHCFTVIRETLAYHEYYPIHL